MSRSKPGEVLSVVERGWRGARECSLVLSAKAIPVTHLIKGYVNTELLAMIQPVPHMRIISAPRPLFRLWLWWALGWGTLTRRLRCVLIDHERTLREVSWWCRLWGLASVTIRDTDEGYDLQRGRERLSLEQLLGIVGKRALGEEPATSARRFRTGALGAETGGQTVSRSVED